MSRDTNRCTEPEFYTSQSPDSTFIEGRAILLSQYAEKELEPPLENLIRQHLDRCSCCTEFFKKLTHEAEFRVPKGEIIYASCPSSKNLTDYVFGQNSSAPENLRIEKHLQDCPLCKEESEWLRRTAAAWESQDPTSALPRKNYLQYLSIAAAFIFFVISVFFLGQRVAIKNTQEQLSAMAVVKSAHEIDFSELNRTSISLPSQMIGIYEKGVESVKKGEYQEAIRHLELVTTSHPDHSGAIYLLGYSYYQMNQLERAYHLCDRAEVIYPKSLERCLTLVNVALKAGHYGRALDEISGLHHVAPDHPEVKKTYERIATITRGRTLEL